MLGSQHQDVIYIFLSCGKPLSLFTFPCYLRGTSPPPIMSFCPAKGLFSNQFAQIYTVWPKNIPQGKAPNKTYMFHVAKISSVPMLAAHISLVADWRKYHMSGFDASIKHLSPAHQGSPPPTKTIWIRFQLLASRSAFAKSSLVPSICLFEIALNYFHRHAVKRRIELREYLHHCPFGL